MTRLREFAAQWVSDGGELDPDDAVELVSALMESEIFGSKDKMEEFFDRYRRRPIKEVRAAIKSLHLAEAS